MSTTWSWSPWTASPRAIGDRATTTGTGGPVSPDADAARARYACTEAPARAAQTSDAPAYARDTRDHLPPTCGSFPGEDPRLDDAIPAAQRGAMSQRTVRPEGSTSSPRIGPTGHLGAHGSAAQVIEGM